MSFNNTLESKVIDWLRFPMAAAVVLLHTGSLGCDSSYPIYSTLCIILPNGICRIAVPLFMLFSGYFFFKGLEVWDKSLYCEKLRKRINTLLLPYLAWNLLAFLLTFGYTALRLKLHEELDPSFLNQVRGWNFFRIFWNYNEGMPIDYPLWFVRDLFLFTIASPLLFFFIKKGQLAFIIILALIYLAFGGFTESLFFFSLGGYLRITGSQIVSSSSRIKGLSYIGSILLLFAIALCYKDYPTIYDYLKRCFVFLGANATINLTTRGFITNRLKPTPFLAHSSFFIFAAHAILILHDFAHYIILHSLPFGGELYYCLDLFLRSTLAIVMCLSLYWLLNRSSPRLLGFLTGGRIYHTDPRTI